MGTISVTKESHIGSGLLNSSSDSLMLPLPNGKKHRSLKKAFLCFKVYCLTGTGVKTPSRYDFTAGRFPRSKPIISNEDGDGIINRRSLDGCELWTNQQEEPVVIQKFPGVDHREIPKDLKVISYIKSILLP